MIICSNCGKFIEDEVTKCPECDFLLEKNSLDLNNNETTTNVVTAVVNESEVITDIITDLKNINSLDMDIFSHNSSSRITDIMGDNQTQIQTIKATLTHVQTNIILEIPLELTVIHIGKPNEKSPPDIDVSGFPNSQVVSRIHANIIQEDDNFYIEDSGSANGTYINHTPLATGNRHRLKSGDRIALGKEDKVSFIFEFAMLTT
ncbi:FHA domain containing protein [Geminocystis sp. NIES-3708]|uniref:FHA domain-containing protein n=1 Tax=Geminocystis sp. NIES-3708 TaxID=1615909 RepID=UPI0005FC9ED1|nr:FHA domain-containing protein [Geminocystis sp. NIES-3708]BAQ62107.1 FHA domain containing protein [Geminocystis sp. NIES-3708]